MAFDYSSGGEQLRSLHRRHFTAILRVSHSTGRDQVWGGHQRNFWRSADVVSGKNAKAVLLWQSEYCTFSSSAWLTLTFENRTSRKNKHGTSACLIKMLSSCQDWYFFVFWFFFLPCEGQYILNFWNFRNLYLTFNRYSIYMEIWLTTFKVHEFLVNAIKTFLEFVIKSWHLQKSRTWLVLLSSPLQAVLGN